MQLLSFACNNKDKGSFIASTGEGENEAVEYCCNVKGALTQMNPSTFTNE